MNEITYNNLIKVLNIKLGEEKFKLEVQKYILKNNIKNRTPEEMLSNLSKKDRYAIVNYICDYYCIDRLKYIE